MTATQPELPAAAARRLAVKAWLTVHLRVPAARYSRWVWHATAVRALPGLAGVGGISAGVGGVITRAFPGHGYGPWVAALAAGWFLLRLDSRIG